MKTNAMMTIALLCAVAQGAWGQMSGEGSAENFSYIKRSWDNVSKTLMSETVTQQSINSVTLSGSHPDEWLGLGSGDDSEDHYYVVKGTVSYQTLNVYGRAHLILSDGATLTCTGGIKVEKTNNNAQLFIYSQSDGSSQGQLTVTNSYENAAGIGSSGGKECGEITIHGGTIDVTGGKYAAGIGAGAFLSPGRSKDGITTIYGGTVTAKGGEFGAGIGGGAGRDYGGCDGGTFSLYGGTVTATGGYYAAGVGGGGSYQIYGMNSLGDGGKLGIVSIYGGTLNAQGGHRGAGIGGGNHSGYNYMKDCANGGTVHIYNNAVVNATGGAYGAGIGGGQDSHGAYVTIDGGIVTATGGTDGAGIGGGENGDGSILTINGGHVTAKGTGYGAGIGGGEHTFTLNWVHGRGSDTYINGGTVIAVAGENCKSRESSGGSAIGGGDGVGGKTKLLLPRKLEIADNMMVRGGDAENKIERVFTVAERIDACRWRNYVKIEVCEHTARNGDAADVATTYTVADDDNHIKHCRYCAVTSKEIHDSEVTCVCGYQSQKQFTVYQAGETKDSYDGGSSTTVGVGNYFLLPECTNVPEGYIFAGWEMNPNPEDGNNWAAVLGEDFIQPQQAVQALAGQDDAKFYARFLYDFTVEWMWDENYPTQGTIVRLTHPDIVETINVHPTAITSEDLLDDNDQPIGTRYTGKATYGLNGFTYSFTNVRDVLPSFSLSDASDNTEELDSNNGRIANVTLSGRTLYKDGSWNTLCLPFDVTLSGSVLDGDNVDVRTLSSTEYTNGTLTLNFTAKGAVSELQAGTPYIIKWGNTEGTELNNLNNPTFEKVTIKNVCEAVTDDHVSFTGFFSPVGLAANDNTVLFLGAGNTLYYPSDDMTIGACRAIFVLNGLTASASPNPSQGETGVRAFVLNFGGDGSADGSSASGITVVSPATDADGDVRAPGWYAVDGMRLDGKPTARGIYIHNGRKVVIK